MSMIMSVPENNYDARISHHILVHNLLFELCTGQMIVLKNIAQLWCKRSYRFVSLFIVFNQRDSYSFSSQKS